MQRKWYKGKTQGDYNFGRKMQELFDDFQIPVRFSYLFQQCFTNLPHWKQRRWNKFKRGGTINLQVNRAEKNLNCCTQTVTSTLKISNISGSDWIIFSLQ